MSIGKGFTKFKVLSRFQVVMMVLIFVVSLVLLSMSATVSANPATNSAIKNSEGSVANQSEKSDIKRVYMVLWRGLTDAERGFMDALMNQKHPVEFIIRNAGKNRTTLKHIRADILRQQPDLVYSFGTTVTATLAGTEANVEAGVNITEIPLVFNIVADPKGAGIVSDYQHPGRNVTGTSHLVPMATQVAAMQEMESVKTVAVIYNPREKNSTLQVKALKKATEAAGLRLVAFALPDAEDDKAVIYFDTFAQLLREQNVDVAYLPSDSFLIYHAKSLVKTVHNAGVPVFSATEGPIRRAGAYMGIVSRYYNVGQFAAYKAEQLLFKDKTVAEVPVQTLKRFSVIVNMDAAKTLDIYPPVTIMQTAEVVRDQ